MFFLRRPFLPLLHLICFHLGPGRQPCLYITTTILTMRLFGAYPRPLYRRPIFRRRAASILHLMTSSSSVGQGLVGQIIPGFPPLALPVLTPRAARPILPPCCPDFPSTMTMIFAGARRLRLALVRVLCAPSLLRLRSDDETENRLRPLVGWELPRPFLHFWSGPHRLPLSPEEPCRFLPRIRQRRGSSREARRNSPLSLRPLVWAPDRLLTTSRKGFLKGAIHLLLHLCMRRRSRISLRKSFSYFVVFRNLQRPSSFLSNPSARDSISHLTLLQSLIIELGLATSSLPGSLTSAKAFLKSRAFLNVREYLAVRSEGPAALQRVMYPSKSALIKDIKKKRNPASLRWVKRNGLQVLLVSCYH